MRISKQFPSNWLKAEDIGKGRKVRCVVERVEEEKIGEDHKPVIYFRSKEKGLVLNKTNALKIADVYGDETDEWEDKEVLLYVEVVAFQGRPVPAIRVEIPLPEVAATEDDPPF